MHVKEQKRRHSKQLQSVLIKKKGSATALGSWRGPEGVVAEIQEQLPLPAPRRRRRLRTRPGAIRCIPVIQEAAVSAVCTPTG